MQLGKNKRKETLVYLVLWGLLFMAPVMSQYIRSANVSAHAFDWSEIFMVWREYGLYFAVFLIHNHLLAPLLVYRQRLRFGEHGSGVNKALYFSIVAVLVTLFSYYQCSTGPGDLPDRGPRHEMMGERRPPQFDDQRPPQFDDQRPPQFDDQRPPQFDDQRPPQLDDQRRPPQLDERRNHGAPPPLMFSPHDLTAIIVLVLMLFANLGIKLYFKQRRDQLQLAELEKKNLEQQLAYLKYQLNPHFLMNTLNNIHALVDIDSERSKEAIIQLSKILRYVLYESNHERVPMTKEIEFLDNYCLLMRMRYGDKLSFTANNPDDVTGMMVPPLLFITFVENAFKHGVSYQNPSFIAIDCKRCKGKHGEERLLWTCRNSKHAKADTTAIPRQGGVGMANVRQRLDLIYGNDYSLGIHETDDTYEVILDIP